MITKKEVTVGILFSNEYKDLDNLFRSLVTEKDYIYHILILCNMVDDYRKLSNIMIKYKLHFDISGITYDNINTGCAGGRNKLIRSCSIFNIKYIMFCDADLTVTEGMVGILLKTIKKYRRIYAIVPKMYFGGTKRFWWNGSYDKHHRIIKDSKVLDTQNNNTVKYGSFVGTCSLIDIKEFKGNNLWFDNEFFIYHEDVDAMEFLGNTTHCLYEPEALAYHNVNLEVTGKYFDMFRHYMTFRNRIIIGIKHFDFIGLLSTFTCYLKMLEFSFKLKLRAILYGVKLGLFKLFGFYKGKIIDSREYKFVHKFSKNRLILR